MAAMVKNVDFLIVGAGIAGASVAAELSHEARVLVAEMEAQPGYHTTGRSAALFVPTYGPPPIRALTRASEAFFLDPPENFSGNALLAPRSELLIARHDQLASLEKIYAEIMHESSVERLDQRHVREVQPLLRDGYAAGALLDHGSQDIDVNALHQGYLRIARAGGADLRTSAELTSLQRDGDGWKAVIGGETMFASIIVNAAGAWADKVGALAGAENIGLVPKRRTALVIAGPDGVKTERLPATIDVDEKFYLKPDAGRLLISPANEDPEPPCDVQPDEMDIAICIDRIETAFNLEITRIENKWAGLRSFVSDKCPVVGFSRKVAGFF